MIDARGMWLSIAGRKFTAYAPRRLKGRHMQLGKPGTEHGAFPQVRACFAECGLRIKGGLHAAGFAHHLAKIKL